MTTYPLRLAALVSQSLNCILLLGHHDQTVSARCYINRHKPIWKVTYRIINTVFFWQGDHCKSSFQRDVQFAREVLKYE